MAAFAGMTEENVSILTLVEALIAPISDQITTLGEQIKTSDARRGEEIARLTIRIGDVESQLKVADAAESSRSRTLRRIAAVVTGVIAATAAIGGFVLAILQAASN